MAVFSAEKVQEMVEEKEAEYKKLMWTPCQGHQIKRRLKMIRNKDIL